MTDKESILSTIVAALDEVPGPEAAALRRAVQNSRRMFIASTGLPPGIDREARTLRLLAAVREEMAHVEGEEARRLRAEYSVTWPQLAKVTGYGTKQAAYARYANRSSRPADTADVPATSERAWLTVQDAAAQVGISERTAQRWCKAQSDAGGSGARKKAGAWLVNVADLRRHIERKRSA